MLPEGRWDLAPTLLLARLAHALGRPTHDLVLGNRREVHHTNSTLAWSLGPPAVHLSPADAAAAGVGDGDTVEVTSPHGSLTGVVQVDDGLARGTVNVPHGFAAPNVGHLTATDVDVDPLTGMPTLIGIPVALRQLSESRNANE